MSSKTLRYSSFDNLRCSQFLSSTQVNFTIIISVFEYAQTLLSSSRDLGDDNSNRDMDISTTAIGDVEEDSPEAIEDNSMYEDDKEEYHPPHSLRLITPPFHL